MDHSFNIEIAKDVGVVGAILLNNIYWWVDKNSKNDTNFFDGKYWTYNKKNAYIEQFPYLTERQIEYGLSKLRDAGYIEVGNYNKYKYDRTLWYTLTEKAYAKLHICNIHPQNFVNGATKNATPIQDINKDINKDKENVEPCSTIPYSDIINYLNEKAGTNFRGSSKDNQKHITARWNDGFRLHDFYLVIDIKVSEWKTDKKMSPYLRPSTLFGTKFESYLQQAVKGKRDNSATAISKPCGETAKDSDGKEIVY